MQTYVFNFKAPENRNQVPSLQVALISTSMEKSYSDVFFILENGQSCQKKGY